MTAGERRVRRNAAPAGSANQENGHAPAETNSVGTGSKRRKTTVASLEAETAARGCEGRLRARADAPAVAHCADLDLLRTLAPAEARLHVDAYLRSVMSAGEADDFEALRYRWELHLVELDQLQLVRTVDLNKRKLAHYRAVLRQGGAFPPLLGLGGDGRGVTAGVLLLDGYHRALAMRDTGLCFAWMWLATATWAPLAEPVAYASRGRA